MARPTKQGIDYFPLDVDFLRNIKVRKIKRTCGPQTVEILLCLLGNIYRDNGYYIGWDEDSMFLVADEVGAKEGLVKEIVDKAVQVGFFDKSKFDEYQILTSHGIQERYKEATTKRKNVELKKQFLVNDVNNRVNDGNNPTSSVVNGVNNQQSKVNKSKVNKNKDKDAEKTAPQSSKSKQKYSDDDQNLILATALLKAIRENNDEFKQPNLQRWANDIRLMHERDNRKYEQISNMITWCQQHDFWSTVVLSASSLRKNYDQMRTQALNDAKVKPNRGKKVNPEPLPEWLNNEFDETKANAEQHQDSELADRIKKLNQEAKS